MKTKTKLMLTILHILSLIIFVGVSIEAGGFIVNAIGALVKPASVKYLWHIADLSALLNYDHNLFFTLLVTMSIVAVLKACLFYLIIDILHRKKLNITSPFNMGIDNFAQKAAYITSLIGLFSWCGVQFVQWLIQQGVKMPDIQLMRIDGADVWLFMSVTLFVIAQIFKRGIEIQTENDLTV